MAMIAANAMMIFTLASSRWMKLSLYACFSIRKSSSIMAPL